MKTDDGQGVPGGVPTGSAALDDILCGGYERARVHLIEGQPGSGKTTLALQFLLEGVRRGERCLYVTLSRASANCAPSSPVMAGH